MLRFFDKLFIRANEIIRQKKEEFLLSLDISLCLFFAIVFIMAYNAAQNASASRHHFYQHPLRLLDCGKVTTLVTKYGGLTKPSRYHATIVRHQSSPVILAVSLHLNNTTFT